MKYRHIVFYLCVFSVLLAGSAAPAAAGRNISLALEPAQDSYLPGDVVTLVIKVDDATDIVWGQVGIDYDYDIFNEVRPENSFVNSGFQYGGENPPEDGMFGYPLVAGETTVIPCIGQPHSQIPRMLQMIGAGVGDDGGGRLTGEQVMFKVPFTVQVINSASSHSLVVHQMEICKMEAGWIQNDDGDVNCETGEFVPAPVLIGAVKNTDPNWGDLTAAFFQPEVNYADETERILAQVDVNIAPHVTIVQEPADTHYSSTAFNVSLTEGAGQIQYRWRGTGSWSDWLDYDGQIVFGSDQEDGTSVTYYLQARVVGAEDYTYSAWFNVDKQPPTLMWGNSYGQTVDTGDDDEPKQTKDWWVKFSEANCTIEYVVTQDPTPPDPWDEFYVAMKYTFSDQIVKGDGDGKWYLHAHGIDGAGNPSNTVTGYAILDNTAPSAPTVASSSPALDTQVAANGKISLTWNPAQDAFNGLEADGIAGYFWVLDTQSDSSPGTALETALPDTVQMGDAGSYYLHVAAQDKAGNTSETYHYGPFEVVAVPMGDVNSDLQVTLEDAIAALKAMAGVEKDPAANAGADVDGDGKIGMAEVLYILRYVSGL